MDLYGPSFEAASTRISTGWPYIANAASPSRATDFILVSRPLKILDAPSRSRLRLEHRSRHFRDNSLVNLQHHHAVRRNIDLIPGGRLNVFVRPQIAHL